jgi:hypothetical protein
MMRIEKVVPVRGGASPMISDNQMEDKRKKKGENVSRKVRNMLKQEKLLFKTFHSGKQQFSFLKRYRKTPERSSGVLYDKKHLFFEMSFHYSTRAVVTISKL